MGMFDEIYINNRLMHDYSIRCSKCKKERSDYQTKSFDNVLERYYLRYTSDGPRLSFMQNPEKQQMFDYAVDKSFRPIDPDLEWPHQWVIMHSSCSECEEWNEWKLKFTDGILQKVERVELVIVKSKPNVLGTWSPKTDGKIFKRRP